MTVLAITLPIYLAIALGYGAVRAGWFTAAHMQMLGQYVMNIAMPAMLFNAMATRAVSEVFLADYALVIGLAGLATITLGYLWFSRAGVGASRRAVAILGMTCPNSAFIGYPVMLLIFPDLAGVVLALNFLVENIVLVPICLILLDMAGADHGAHVTRRLAQVFMNFIRRPMMIGLLLGLIVSALQIPVPGPVLRLTGMLAESAAAPALIIIGGSLVGLSTHGNRLVAAQIAFGKLLVQPALVALVLLAGGLFGLHLSADLFTAALLWGAMPMFGIYTVLAQQQGHEGMASIAMMVTTSLAFFTLSAFLIFLL